MKTFNEKDLITWSNREKAVIGNEYYFGNCLYDIKYRIKEGIYTVLTAIDNNCYNYPFHIERTSNEVCCACLLPVDALKEEEKEYRACRNVKELYELILNTKSKADPEFYINELVGTVIHFRLKGFDSTVYGCITGIVVYNNGDIAVHIDGRNFELDELFKNYKIEINGKWLPFGVEV